MGYCMTQLSGGIEILKENQEGALNAVLALEPGSWVQDDYLRLDPSLSVQEKLKRALHCWRYNAEFNSEGKITWLDFGGEKLGDDPKLFKALAPFIDEGCEMVFRGEDGLKWKYVFDGEKMEEITADETWEDEVIDPVELLANFLETEPAREYIKPLHAHNFLEKFRAFHKKYRA